MNRIIFPAALALTAGHGIYAQQTNIEEPAAEQQRMVVTASRLAESQDQALASVSIIDHRAIELSAAEDLLELLRLEAGVDIVRSGPAGAQTSVFMRGTNSNHTLVLIDGVRVSSTNTGAFGWENLPLNQVQRIEIVRGPRASVYGSDAIGGVIQIFTRTDDSPHLRVTGGSFGSVEASGGLGWRSENNRINLAAGYRDSDGFSAQNPAGFSFDPDDDGHENQNLLLNGNSAWRSGSLGYSLLLATTETEFDQGISDADQRLASISYRSDPQSSWHYQIQLGYADDELDSDFGFFSTAFESNRLDLGWHNQYRLNADLHLLFGLDYYDESGSNGTGYDESRDNAGLYLGVKRNTAGHDFEASLRYDDNSEFGSEVTGQLAWGYQLSGQWRIFASYGEAFRAPNLNEQFSPGFGGLFAGNPDLQPEFSDSLELGLNWTPAGNQSLSVNLYQTDIDNLIAFNGADFQAININRASIDGVELQWAYRPANWRIKTSVTYQDTEDESNGLALLRRPEYKAAANVQRLLANGGWIGGELFYSDSRRDLGGDLDSYQLLNLTAGWPVGDHWQLEARIENLLDEDYQPAIGFNAMDRAAFASLHWRP